MTPRFLRHFNIFSINAFSDDTMLRIFSNVTAFYLKNNDFPPEYFTVGNQIVTATMEVSRLDPQRRIDAFFHGSDTLIGHILPRLHRMLLIPKGV